MPTTVKRDGAVVVDGKTIGRVEKEMRQGLFATALGVGYSGAGTPYWVPFDADGNKLHDGYDTRKRAVSRVESAAQPLKAEKFERKNYWPLLGGGDPRPYVSGWVSMQGHSFGVSRYADEAHWVVDCYFPAGSIMPSWSNGDGSRVTSAHVLKGDAAEAATDAAIAAGVWPIASDA